MGAIKEKMMRDLTLRGFSERTMETYIDCIKQFVIYHKKSPELLTMDDIHRYQLHLKEEREISTSYFNIQVAALRFLYRITLEKPWNIEMIPYTKRPKRLPVVLSRDEFIRIYYATGNIKHQAIILTLYSTGLRASELVHLKVDDIDSKRMLIRVNEGKGKKDRYTLLSPTLVKKLRQYWLSTTPRLHSWLFPGYNGTPMNRSTLRKMVSTLKDKAGITKPVTTHTFRHTFASRLLESGVDIKRIQILMGHASLKTTSRYIHIGSRFLTETKSPLEELNLSLE